MWRCWLWTPSEVWRTRTGVGAGIYDSELWRCWLRMQSEAKAYDQWVRGVAQTTAKGVNVTQWGMDAKRDLVMIYVCVVSNGGKGYACAC